MRVGSLLTAVLPQMAVSAMSDGFGAPQVPDSGRAFMPEASSLSEGIRMILQDVIPLIRPDLYPVYVWP